MRPHAHGAVQTRGEVARAVAQQRRGLAVEVGPHELAARRRRSSGSGSAVSGSMTSSSACSPVVRCSPSPWPHSPAIVDHMSLMPNVSVTVTSHALLDLGADGGEPGARLARGDDVAQAERGRVEPGLAGAGGEVGGEGERAEDRGDAEARDQVEQPPRLADADRHDRRAARLDRHVVGDAAGVERVVEAVRDGVGGAQAGDRERLAADLASSPRGRRCVSPIATGSPVVPEVTCRRTRSSRSRAQVLAERRAAVLALAQLVLGREREVGELARGRGCARGRTPSSPRGSRAARRARSCRDLLGRLAAARGASGAGGRPRAASSPATTSAAPATARPVIASS